MDVLALANQTARSFALTLRLLPAVVRGEIAISYLLARASDTIADTLAIPLADRVATLTLIHESFAGRTPTRFPIAVVRNMAAFVPHPGEAALLAEIESLVIAACQQPEPELDRACQVLATITSGQLLDANRGVSGAMLLADESALDDYTWRVAGCVGEYWTAVLAAKMPSALGQPVEVMARLGKNYGQGLQLLNILRDAPSDWQAGRSYLPGGWGSTAPLPPDPAGLPVLYELMQKRIDQCSELLDDGVRYWHGMTGWRIRAASALPVAFGKETLSILAAADSAAWLARVKISRDSVRKIGIHTLWATLVA